MKHHLPHIFMLVSLSVFEASSILPTVSGDTSSEIFQKYRCKVCVDIMTDNIELIDGELVINENVAVKICDKFFSEILHNSFGGIFCHTVVQTQLDKFLKGFVASGEDTRIGENICKALHFCG